MPKLSPAEVEQFFKLFGALHLFVNEQLHLLPNIHTTEQVDELRLEDRVKLRDALYDHPELFDRFIAENPAGLTADDLEVVRRWATGFVRGDFYLVRHLKAFSVFLSSGKPARAYGVVGLVEPIDEKFPTYALPLYLTTVLLPFHGKIVWDGFAHSYNVVFGSGIRGDLNETYQRIKQRQGIIATLPGPGDASAAPAGATRSHKSQPDLRPIAQRIVEASEQLRPGATPLQSRTYSFLRAAAQLADAVTRDPDNLRTFSEQMNVVNRTYRQLYTAYERESDSEDTL